MRQSRNLSYAIIIVSYSTKITNSLKDYNMAKTQIKIKEQVLTENKEFEKNIKLMEDKISKL
jgi:hypothetical protein